MDRYACKWYFHYECLSTDEFVVLFVWLKTSFHSCLLSEYEKTIPLVSYPCILYLFCIAGPETLSYLTCVFLHLNWSIAWNTTCTKLKPLSTCIAKIAQLSLLNRKSHQWISERASRPSDFTRMMLSAEMIIVSNFTVSGKEVSPSCSLSRCPRDEDCTDTLCPESQDKKVVIY